MGKILALDIGGKRTGIAETDPLQLIATGLTTVETNELIDFLKSLVLRSEVETIVVGDPIQMDGTASESSTIVNEQIGRLRSSFPDVNIERMDERFTSKLASQAMYMSGLKKKKRQEKALVDEVSATILLQDYLTRK